MVKKLSGIFAAIILCGMLSGGPVSAMADQAKGGILVKFKAGAENAGMNALQQRFSARTAGKFEAIDTYIVGIPEASQAEILKQLANEGQTIGNIPGTVDANKEWW